MKLRFIIILLISSFLLCTRSTEPPQPPTQGGESPTLIARIEARIDPSTLIVLLEGLEDTNLQPMSSSSEGNCVMDEKGKAGFAEPSVVTKKDGVLSFSTSVKNLTTEPWTGVNLTLTGSDDETVSPANPSNGEGKGSWFWALHDIPAGQESSPTTLSLNVPEEKPFKMTLELHSGNPDIEDIERDCDNGTITIKGKNLGPDPEKGHRATVSHNITINGRVIQDDEVLSWEDTKITAVLDNGETEGFVAVTKGGQHTCKKRVEKCPPTPPPPSCPSLSQWSATSSLNVPRQMLAAVAVNNWIYAIGGLNSGGATVALVEMAQINPDGSLGSWITTSSLNVSRANIHAVSYNGYLYVAGGTSGYPGKFDQLSSVEYAKINPDGTLVSWTLATSMNQVRYFPGLVAYNGWLYTLGGWDGNTCLSSSERAPIIADGSIGNWQTASSIPYGNEAFVAVVNNGWIYIMGGWNGATTFGQVWKAQISAEGNLGEWTNESSLNIPRAGFGGGIHEGKICVGGGVQWTTMILPAECAVIDPDGGLEPWCIEPELPAAAANVGGCVSNGWFYIVGGNNSVPQTLSTVFKAQIQ